jgi:hypothetical protein
VVDYLGTENATTNVIVLRPGHTPLFREILSAIVQTKGDERAIEESIVATIDFALTAYILTNIVDMSGFFAPGSVREKIYNFLIENKFGEWSGFLSRGLSDEEVEKFRCYERTGRPLGTNRFIVRLENVPGRMLNKQKPGPKALQKKNKNL